MKSSQYIIQKILGGKAYVISQYQNYYRLVCFYTLRLDEQKNIIKPDERVKKFGTHFSIVNRAKLVSALNKTIENTDIAFLDTYVSYISEHYRGVYTPGCKFEKYGYQNEYRLILASPRFGELPEMEKQVINLSEVGKEDLLSEPLPIELLWSTKGLTELREIVDNADDKYKTPVL